MGHCYSCNCCKKKTRQDKNTVEVGHLKPTEVSIPDVVLQGLVKAFTGDKDKDSLSRIFFCLSKAIGEKIGQPLIDSLKDVVSNPSVFKDVAERMVEDTKTAETDPQYRQVLFDVWNNFMKEGPEHPDISQIMKVAIPSEDAYVLMQVCFMGAVSRLPPEQYTLLARTAKAMGGQLAVYGGRALTYARKERPVKIIGLVATALSQNIIKNIKRWWKGEITGKQCVKNILDNGAGVAAGVAGFIGGEMIGATVGAFAGPLGMAAGAIVGAVAGRYVAALTAESLSDRLTQWAFGLSKSEALENAYNFLGVPASASDSDINTKYRQLALKYDPKKGGDSEKWTRLQYSLAVIREARGEP